MQDFDFPTSEFLQAWTIWLATWYSCNQFNWILQNKNVAFSLHDAQKRQNYLGKCTHAAIGNVVREVEDLVSLLLTSTYKLEVSLMDWITMRSVSGPDWKTLLQISIKWRQGDCLGAKFVSEIRINLHALKWV